MTLLQTEISRAQIPEQWMPDELGKKLPQSYDTYRTIRKHPTVAMARALSTAAIVSGEWTVFAKKGVPKFIRRFVKDTYFKHRRWFLQQAITGGIDYGYQGFEQVYALKSGRIVIDKLKPLIPDATIILVDEDNGDFQGYRQDFGFRREIPLSKCLHVAYRIEGTDWRGESLLEYARNTYNHWIDGNDAARRYDKKMAGSHFVVYYPMGETEVDGTMTDNATIAKNVLTNLESSGGTTIPRLVAEHVEDLRDKEFGWDIEILNDDNARQYSFTNRLEYLDKLLVRAMLMPERAIIEGKFGTKADAGSHADLAMVNVEETHAYTTEHINQQSVDRLVEVNFGPKHVGNVGLASAPLSNSKIQFFRDVYIKFLDDPQGFINEYNNTERESLRELLCLPQTDAEDKDPIERPAPPVFNSGEDDNDNEEDDV